MKTSNKLLITAVLLFLSLQAVYNVALTEAYNKGDFRDPYKDFTSLENRDFDKITVNSASKMRVEIMQGDYHVRVHEKASPYVKVTQRSKELILDVEFSDEKIKSASEQHVVIFCPDLKSLRTDGVYTLNGRKQVDNAILERYGWLYNVAIKDMKLDSLTIHQDNASSIVLKDNTINVLNATVGLSQGSGPKLYVLKGNDIKQGKMDVQNLSELVLEDATPNMTLNHSNTAKIVLSGASLSLLKE